MTTLLHFARLVLRLVPPLLWWALGGLVFSLLNNVFHAELWPSTPAARPVVLTLLFGCLLTLPWIAARVAWRLSDAVESYFWKAVWRFAALAGYGGAVLSLLGGMVAIGFMWTEWIASN
ncbi:hypothetical protein [Hymenobacter algoricola]|uniref:Uncharacterized protein n=1 Tax=Hymenobacter algoricola TaxID=486267 RepID=A0ABP7NUW9_9BACT